MDKLAEMKLGDSVTLRGIAYRVIDNKFGKAVASEPYIKLGYIRYGNGGLKI